VQGAMLPAGVKGQRPLWGMGQSPMLVVRGDNIARKTYP